MVFPGRKGAVWLLSSGRLLRPVKKPILMRTISAQQTLHSPTIVYRHLLATAFVLTSLEQSSDLPIVLSPHSKGGG
jgi:hypothetical protein